MERNTGSNLLGRLTPEKKSGLVYSGAAVASLLLSFVLVVALSLAGVDPAEAAHADWYLYLSFLLAPVAFAIVVAVWFVRTKDSPKAVVGKCRAKYFLLAVLLQIGLLSLSEVNTQFISFLERFGYVPSEVEIPSLDGGKVIGVLIAVALLPAIGEELIFRGLLLKGMKSFGLVGAALLCGALFSLFHQNPVQTVYQFICGAAFAFVALLSGSILPTILSHFINNAAIILLAKFGYSEIPAAAAVPVLIVSVLCLIGSVVWIVLEALKRKKAPPTAGGTGGTDEGEAPDRKGFFFGAALGIALCAVVWLSGLFTGFGG